MDNEYLSSKEFRTLCDITKNTLVWYEKKGLLSPGFTAENGYHYYSLEQFYEIDLIKVLKWADKSLEDCKEYIDNRTSTLFLSMMLEQQEILQKKIEQLLQQKKVVDRGIQDYLSMQSRLTIIPQIVHHPSIWLLMEKIDITSDKGYVQALSRLYDTFHRSFSTYGSVPTMLNSAIVRQEDIENYKDYRHSFVCLKINKPIPNTLCEHFPEGDYVVCFHKGDPKCILETYQKMLDFISLNGLRIAGNILENDYINYLSTRDSKSFCKEILIPVI